MDTAEIRRRFLAHFEARDHTLVPSAPLLLDDPTLLFVGAGMVPFKPYFLGQEAPPYRRAVSVQKCVRTTDIEEVGKTDRHGTFFQMNGNFSFGDYFKEGAIQHAWDLVTRPRDDGGYGLEESRLHVSVYLDDDESVALWKRIAGLPDDRIHRLGMADNFWSMGVSGPCGPDSEIFLDRGPEHGPDGDIEKAGDRYLEFWNLVFMQSQRGPSDENGDFEILGDLPAKNIDTGMGLERMAMLLQGKGSIYEIDEVLPVLERAAGLAGKRYGVDHGDDVRLRVVADHVRSGLMLIADGVTPGNEARGYVLRRILRRAVRAMRLLGVEDRVLPELLPVSLDRMRLSYPELDAEWARISTVAYAEEDAFRQTLRAGTAIFDLAVGETRSGGQVELSGAKAFQLHDTFGFPIDITLEMAAEQGLSVDEVGFRQLMSEQRDRAKADAKAKKGQHADARVYRDVADAMGRAVEFTGYDEVVSEARVTGILDDTGRVDHVGEGETFELVLDRTPFYAEGGGQLADRGLVELSNGARVEVVDVQSPTTGVIVHHARVLTGEVTSGLQARAVVDVERRKSISRAHTATHMVHKAFREALGETATQAGSENAPGRFRFDFSATGAVPTSVLAEVEAKVNDLVLADLSVQASLMTQSQARASGAMALFGEKYGDQVRVISVGDWARELCGGTHAGRSGQLGVIKLLGESSIGSGVRRVEALVGADAYQFLAREHMLVAQLTQALKVRPEELPERVNDIVERLRRAEKEIERVRVVSLLARAGEFASSPRDVCGVRYVGQVVEGAGAADVRRLVLDVRSRMGVDAPAVVAVVGSSDGKPSVVVAVNEVAREQGISAGVLVREAAVALGGSGGGKDDVAQGGGTDVSQARAALEQVERAVGRLLTSS
ncbi:MAG: alanine--tRNA ligase [Propionibacteriales bacterium]|nr:alanine--tRNA ligase [Propionibacteriales bacterium]